MLRFVAVPLRQQRPLKVSNRCYPLQPEQTRNLQCCESGSRIRDQGSGVFLIPWFAIWDPVLGSGIGKKSGSRSGIRDGKPWSYFWELRNHFFWLKYLNSLMCIPDPGSVMEKIQIRDQGSRMEKIWIQDPGSRMEKIRIRDPGSRVKHTGSPKLEISSPKLLGLKELNNNRTLCEKGMSGWDQVIFSI